MEEQLKKILKDFYRYTVADNQFDLVRGLTCLSKLCLELQDQGILNEEKIKKIMTIDKVDRKKIEEELYGE